MINTVKTYPRVLFAAVVLCAALLVFQRSAGAIPVEVLPVAYSFNVATECGWYCYADETGQQLIDGEYGTTPWWTDRGLGPAYEWVGWQGESVVNIDFDFGAPAAIQTIAIGTIQDYLAFDTYPNDVVLPNSGIYQSTDNLTWSLIGSRTIPADALNDWQYHTILFDNLSITDRYVRVALSISPDGGPWTFTDEVDFFTVPEPATGMMLFLGLAAAGLLRRRATAK